MSRNTVRAAVRSDSPPEFMRKPRPSALDPVEGEIRRLLSEHPRIPVTVIAERIGWSRGMTILQDRVRELRPLFVPPDPSGRTEYRPGELAQWDLWFPSASVARGRLGGKAAGAGGGVGYSRVMVAEMIPSREAHDILSAHLHCLLDLGGLPRKGVYDNEAALVSRHGGKTALTDPFPAFPGNLGDGGGGTTASPGWPDGHQENHQPPRFRSSPGSVGP